VLSEGIWSYLKGFDFVPDVFVVGALLKGTRKLLNSFWVA
jgi:hypothetical protein